MIVPTLRRQVNKTILVLQHYFFVTPHCLYSAATTDDQLDCDNIVKRFPCLAAVHGKNQQLYVGGTSMAETIASALLPHLQPQHSVLLEYEPGPCFLTKALLERDIFVTCLQKSIDFLPPLQELNTIHHDRMTILRGQSPSSRDDSKHHARLRMEIHKYFDSCEKTDWKSECRIKLFRILTSSAQLSYIKSLCVNLLEQTNVYNVGRAEAFFILPDYFYESVLVSKQKYEKSDYKLFSQICLLQHCFDTELLIKLNRNDFLPKYTSKDRRVMAKRNSELTLVRMIPKKTVFDDLNGPQYGHHFVIFLKQILRRGREPLIKKLETWFPNCGLHLQKMGYQTTDYISDCQPSQFREIFMALVRLPEYEDSPFREVLVRQTELV